MNERLGLQRRSQQHFAHERLGLLCHQHRDYVSYIFGLQHLFRILALVRAQLGVNRSGTNDGDADVVAAQLFRD